MEEYITPENKAKLEAEYKELTGPARKKVVDEVAYAKSLGDLSENAEYHQAREEQGKLEDRIQQIDYILKHAKIVHKKTDGSIAIGSVVTIQKEGESNTRVFEIVGSEETDMLAGKISYKSPIGKALVNHKKGDTVVVTTPKGDMHYEILSVQ